MAKARQRPKILFIDAYDSFSENIGALIIETLNVDLTFIKIDVDIGSSSGFETALTNYDALILGPGPGNPTSSSDTGIISSIWNIAQLHTIPVLGICLGFQSLCLTFGAPVVRMPLPCHGLTKEIRHSNTDIFVGVGDLVATNYNSLAVRLSDFEELSSSRPSSVHSSASDQTDSDSDISLRQQSPKGLEVLAWDDFGWTMAARHKSLPFWGLQFHPESCRSSPACRNILKSWWEQTLSWNSMCRDIARDSLNVLGVSPSFFRDQRPESFPLLNSNNSTEWSLCSSKWQAPSLSKDLDSIISHLLQLSASSSPIVHTTTMDLTSPEKIADLCHKESPSWTVLFESTKKGRYSIYAIPSPSDLHLELSTDFLVVSSGSSHRRKYSVMREHVFEILRDVLIARKAEGGDCRIPFWGGFLGFFSYELGLKTAGIGQANMSMSNHTADASLVWVERSVVVDHLEGRVYAQSIRRDDSIWLRQFTEKIALLAQTAISGSLDGDGLNEVLREAQFRLPDQDDYKSNIKGCQRELLAGNSYELCLTVEAQIKLTAGNGWPLYKNLRQCNPVPFAAYLKLGKTTILSSSPEQFLSWSRGGSINMIPMKGTVKKSPDMTFAKASEILASPKESAENLMIADLIRHDLYRALGSNASVEVVKLCEVVEHETVYQLVSHIRANPSAEMNALPEDTRQSRVIERGLTVLQQTMPPGSMTGAPKRRSCEILSQLEQRPRGVYSGVLGYLDVGGGGSFSVCIRTAFSNDEETKDGKQIWRVGAGGAITVLSDPHSEWEEMQTKMESVLQAFRPTQ